MGDIFLRYTSTLDLSSSPHYEQIENFWSFESQKKKLENNFVLCFENISKQNKKIIVDGKFVEYKIILADRFLPNLGLGINQIGVSGIVIVNEDDENFVLFSSRTEQTTEYPGFFELVPSGHIEKSNLLNDGTIDYKAKILNEFIEETGCTKELISSIDSLGLVFDIQNHVYDVCCILHTKETRSKITKNFGNVSEYSKPIMIPFKEIETFKHQNYQKIVPTSLAILECMEKLGKI